LPTIVLVETATGDGSRDARINRLAKTCDIVPLDERIARRAAALRFARPQFGVPDAVVVATADEAGGSIILTTDGRDIRVLAAIRGISEVVAI
jgi:predicted nucleic acid-binding protein